MVCTLWQCYEFCKVDTGAMDSVNAMDGIGTDPSSTSVRLWYDDGTFRARDAYHILGNKRCGRAIGILYKVGKKVGVVKLRVKVFCLEIMHETS